LRSRSTAEIQRAAPVAAIACAVAIGCGRIEYQPRAERFDGAPGEAGPADASIDAARDASPTPDAASDAGPPACTAYSAWSTPRRIEVSTTADEIAPQISADGLNLYYAVFNPGPQTWVAHRPSTSAPFEDPTMIADGASEPGITGDELELFLTASAPEPCIYRASRTDRALPFGPMVRLDALCAGGRVAAGAFVTADGLTLYHGDTDEVVYVTSRASRGDPFPFATEIPELRLAGTHTGWVALSADGLTMYLESDRTTGNADVFSSRRADLSSPFDAPVVVTEVSTPVGAEGDPSISSDHLELYFTAHPGGVGDYDLYVSTRTCIR
jgi:hypothetical protein